MIKLVKNGIWITAAFSLLAAFVLGGCALGGAEGGMHESSPATTPPMATAHADGNSYENAIVIKETNESAGVAAEYSWIQSNIPGAKPKLQSLQSHGGKPYDVIQVELGNGESRNVYFDISNYFGKF
jgi:hypothetical protein